MMMLHLVVLAALLPAVARTLPLKLGGLYVYREVGSVGDRFKPLANDLADDEFCARFTNATSVVNGDEGAICVCNEGSPIFDQASGSCKPHFVDNDACNTSIRFETTNGATYFETHRLFLPLLSQTLNPNYQLDWKGAGVERDQLGWVNCRVGQTSTLLESGGWMATSPPLRSDIFRLVNDTTSTKLKYFGDDSVSAYLNGKQITLTVHCPQHSPLPFYCVQFSVHGMDQGHGLLRSLSGSASASSPPSLSYSESSLAVAGEEGGIGSRPSDVVAIICAILLLLTLVGTAMLWVICWRYHKDKLARRIQMQIIYQQRIQASQIYHDFARNNQAYFGGLDMQMQQGGMQQVIDTGVVAGGSGSPADERCFNGAQHDANLQSLDAQMLNPPPPYPAKKKLFFSPEFFEPEMMETPPPVAEEFLYEVRRMIDVAKGRIRSRRYLPNLGDIPEEHSAGGSDAECSGDASVDLELNCSLSSSANEEDANAHTAARQNANSPGHSSGSQPTSSDSHDSGFASPSKADNTNKQDKVEHWLSKLSEEIDVDESAKACELEPEPEPQQQASGSATNSQQQQQTPRPASPCSSESTSVSSEHMNGGSDGSRSSRASSSGASKSRSADIIGNRNGGLLKYLHRAATTGGGQSDSLPPLRDAQANYKSSALLKRYGIGPSEQFHSLRRGGGDDGSPSPSGSPTVGRGSLGKPARQPQPMQTPLVRTLGSSPIYRPVF